MDAQLLFARAPVYDLILACLSPRTLVRIALTCRAAYLAVAAFKSRAFNVNRHFSRYFTDPLAFRSLQAKTNTLVSGSNALQFLDRTFYPEADLDIYTHPGHSLEVAQFLVEAQGYCYTPRESQDQDWKKAIGEEWDGTARRIAPSRTHHAYPSTGVEGVWSFVKAGNKQECLKIQIIEASSSPLETIFGFHSTCVMNFISSDAAYSLYPTATFEHQSSLCMPSSRHSSNAIEKYVRRGWRAYFIPAPYDMAGPSKSPFWPNKVRWVHDVHTWRVPLDQTGIKARPPSSKTSLPLTCDPVLFNGWKLRVANDMLSNGFECHYHPLQTTVFRYNYAIPEENLSFAIRDWANIQGRFSHNHVSKENWIWFDADIPSFLRER